MLSLRSDARHLAAPVVRGRDDAWAGISAGPAPALLLPPVSVDARTKQLVAGEHLR
jgi:hypothetical protein